MRPARRPGPLRRSTVAAACLAVSLLAAAAPEPLPQSYRGDQRVTAIDVPVEIAGAARAAARHRDPHRFTVLYDGVAQPVVAVGDRGEPWTIVLYFDVELSAAADLRDAAGLLAGEAAALTRLGEVEVVVDDGEPASLLSPTRDAELLGATLSRLALEGGGGDVLRTLRRSFLAELRQPDPMAPVAELASAAVAEERRTVRRQLDDLLLELVDRTTPGARRAVFRVGSGFDLDPAAFYVAAVEEPAAAAGPPPDPERDALDAAVEDTAASLAAYGWITFPLAPPEPPPLPRGMRLGRWRIRGLPPFWFGAVFEEPRDPEKAEAYLELGMSLEGGGALSEAAEAYRKAAYHFYNDPKTADRQALALAHLGRVLAAQGETDAATGAYEASCDLDPEGAGGLAPCGALDLALTPLERLATSTAGRLLRDGEALEEALDSLRRRVSLTYQIAGLPDGALHPLRARLASGKALHAPAWARSSTPDTVAAARLRGLLDGASTAAGNLSLRGRLVPGAAGDRLSAHLTLPPPAPGETPGLALPRVSLATGDPEGALTVHHLLLPPQPAEAGGRLAYETTLALAEDQEWVAVEIEDLVSGCWGARIFEPEDTPHQ